MKSMPTAQRAKVGIPTGEMSEAGKPLYKTAEGETVSEKSITVPFGDKWVNVPSIQDGVRYEDDEIEDMLAAGEIKPTSTHSTMEEAVSAAQERSSGLIKPKMAKGGQVKSQTKRLLAEGGLKHQGGTKDPVSGNNVPVGATQEEVRDDIPAQLSEGEFVFPADVVRYIGLERLMMMRQAAKQGLMKMEDMGQMSNGDEGTEEEDTSDFESEIDEIVGVMGKVDGERKMAEGGMPMPAPAPAQPMAAPAMAPAPSPAAPTAMPATSASAQTSAALGATEKGTPEKDIIVQSMERDNFSDLEKKAFDAFIAKAPTQNVVTLRQKDTLFICLSTGKTDLNVQVFSIEDPEALKESVSKFVDVLKTANITSIQGETKNPELVPALEAAGLTPEVTQVKDVIIYKAPVTPAVEPTQE